MSTADKLAVKIASLRPRHDDLALPDTVDIRRPSGAEDAWGNPVNGTVPVVLGVRAAIDPAGQNASPYIAGSVEEQDRMYDITLPYGTDVQQGDTIIAGAREFDAQQVFEGGGYGIATEVVAKEVTP